MGLLMLKKIAVTGGPCSGKSTFMLYVREKLLDYGVRALAVPESATIMISGAVPDIERIYREDPRLYNLVQQQIFEMQWELERRFEETAGIFANDRVALISDRGAMDSLAYWTEDAFYRALAEHGTNVHEALANYDAVIFLVTAAKGAESFYTTANNAARRETLEEARAVDDKTLRAWIGHPHLIIIDNERSLSFEHKMRRALRAVTRVLGIPAPLEIERKYLVPASLLNAGKDLLRDARVSVIEQMYIDVSSGDEQVRIRKRTYSGHSLCYETRKRRISAAVRTEIERRISSVEYDSLSRLRIPGTRVIQKQRHCFVYHNQYFELDIFEEPSYLCLLEIELTEESETVELPHAWRDLLDVTEDPQFTNYEIARRG